MTSPCILTVVHKQVDLELFYCCYFFLYNACFFCFFLSFNEFGRGEKTPERILLSHFMLYKRKTKIYIFNFPILFRKSYVESGPICMATTFHPKRNFI